jgi:hypothetical protein
VISRLSVEESNVAQSDRKYYVVRHGLDAFEALPNFIWRTGWTKVRPPRRFPHVVEGSRWISFAYTKDDDRTRRLSLVTGFYECIDECRRRAIPRRALTPADKESEAWMIEGCPTGRQPRNGQPVAVPPIHVLLKRSVFNNEAITPIKQEEFELIRRYVLRHQFDNKKIPFLGREPYTEQEVLAMVVVGHKALGIEKILRLQTRFPDLLVKLKGHREPVHLELETYSQSFLQHGHHRHVRNGMLRKGDKRQVGVLCWIHNDTKVERHVHRVYALQDMLRDNQKIRW